MLIAINEIIVRKSKITVWKKNLQDKNSIANAIESLALVIGTPIWLDENAGMAFPQPLGQSVSARAMECGVMV